MIYLKLVIVLISSLFVTEVAPPKVEERQSITFILGTDKGDNQYYKQATQFYKYNDKFSSDFVVEDIKTYKGVFEYLNGFDNRQPWGEINLIVHANPWTGMSVNLEEEGERVNYEVLLESIMSEELKPLYTGVIDQSTNIIVHGCALGLDKEIGDLIAISFGGVEKTGRPQVYVSEKFIAYYSQYFDELYNTERYEATPYFTFYKKGYKKGDIRLARSLKTRYPEAKTDWREALERTMPRWKGDSYYMTFDIPIDWVITYESKENIPKFDTKSDIDNWLMQQEDLVSELMDMGIAFDNFSWSIRETTYEYQDGSLEPAIEIKGRTTVLCVLE